MYPYHKRTTSQFQGPCLSSLSSNWEHINLWIDDIHSEWRPAREASLETAANIIWVALKHFLLWRFLMMDEICI